MLHAFPIPSSFMWLFSLCLANRASQEAPHCAVYMRLTTRCKMNYFVMKCDKGRNSNNAMMKGATRLEVDSEGNYGKLFRFCFSKCVACEHRNFQPAGKTIPVVFSVHHSVWMTISKGAAANCRRCHTRRVIFCRIMCRFVRYSKTIKLSLYQAMEVDSTVR
jgi:hypothetical protein